MTYITQELLDYKKNVLLENKKQEIYKNNLDALTCRKMRYQIQGKEWTAQDEQEYNKMYLKCSELIKEAEEELIPKDITIVSKEEYIKIIEGR